MPSNISKHGGCEEQPPCRIPDERIESSRSKATVVSAGLSLAKKTPNRGETQ